MQTWYAYSAGVHAAAVRALILASRRRDAWLGGATDGDCSFPQTDVDDLHAHTIFFAALTFRSCMPPHALHIHVLTESMSKPVGPVRAWQLLHSLVVFFSLTMKTLLPPCWAL